MFDIDNLKCILEQNLEGARLYHSYCVADEAVRLAKLYGEDTHKAYVAGLLHDITKKFSREQHLKILSDFDIILSDIELISPPLLHAISGEAYLRNIIKIDDREILDAVRFHTTGREGMKKLELILFVADLTSADRDYPDVEVSRAKSNISLEDAALYGLEYVIRDLTQRKKVIHPDTLYAYNYLIKQR